MQQTPLPLAPPWADDALKAKAYAAARATYLYTFAQAQCESQKFAYPVVSTAHLPIARTLRGKALHAMLEKAGFVKLGRSRYPGGYTTMYVQEALRGVYKSPADAFKEFCR